MVEHRQRTGARYFVEAISAYGVRHVFGNPGTTELPVVEAVSDHEECEYVVALHEDAAVGMAAGYAKVRGYHAERDASVTPIGVANLHAAPGLAHGLGNLHGADFAGAPLLVTAGIQSTDFRHEEPILSGDLEAMTRQFTKWSATVQDVSALPAMLRRAVRVALTPPTGPVFLGLPLDVVGAETRAPVAALGEIPTAGRGSRRAIERAAGLLVESTTPVMIVGDHVARAGRGAVEAAVALAEAGGLRVHGEILAAEVGFPGDHELFHSYLPPDEALARRHMAADLVVFAGCSTNTTITAHEAPLVPDDAVCIHLGDDPWELGKNERADSAILGDPRAILDALTDATAERLPESTRQERIDRVRQYVEETRSDTPEPPENAKSISKERLVDTLRDAATEALVVDESVTTKYVLLGRWPLQPEGFLGTKGGGLGYGLPAAVGAAIAEGLRPAPRRVVGLIGDGSFLYYPQSLYTATRYDVELTVVVPDNRSYAVLRDNAVDLLGGTAESHDFEGMGIDMVPSIDVPGFAEAQGFHVTAVDDFDELSSALEIAFGRDRALVDVRVED